MRVETVRLDGPGPLEVLVRVAAAGVGHSDLHLADGDPGAPVTLVLAHGWTLAQGAWDVVAALLDARVAAGRLRVPIAEILPLQEAPEAHRRILKREVSGKLLLQP